MSNSAWKLLIITETTPRREMEKQDITIPFSIFIYITKIKKNQQERR